MFFKYFFATLRRGFENRGIFSDVPQFGLGNLRQRDALTPIVRERKYLMDFKSTVLLHLTYCDIVSHFRKLFDKKKIMVGKNSRARTQGSL